MDNARVTISHWKILFISGMGFFANAYDLFIIGVVMALIQEQWPISKFEVSLVASAALLSSAVGALLFGRIADMVGRKYIYGVEIVIMVAGALACALSPGIWWLIAFRFLLGIGIGGDYPVSATIMSEYSGEKNRGMMVSLVFAMQAVGLILGPLLAAILLATGLSHELIWRILLGFGAIPAIIVYRQRRQLRETPRFLLASGQEEDEHGRIRKASHYDKSQHSMAFLDGFRLIASRERLLPLLLGTSAAWFLMDFAFYGNTIASPLVLSALHSDHSLIEKTVMQLGLFVIFAAPGYALAAYFMDRLGRRTIQCFGFAMMAVCFGIMAFVPNIASLPIFFLIVYGVSYLFTEFGPNVTTFVYPSEIFPVKVRTTGHGISACMGKIGGFLGVFTFPFLMHWKGLTAAEGAAAAVSLVGLIVTLALLPETKGKSLEEITMETASSKVAA